MGLRSVVRSILRIVATAAISVAIIVVVIGIPAILDSGWAWATSGVLSVAVTTVLVSVHRRHKSAVANAVVAHLFISRQWGPALGGQPTLADVVEQSANHRRARRAAAVLCEIVGTAHSGRVLRDDQREAVWEVVRGVDFDTTRIGEATPTDVVGFAGLSGWRSPPKTRPGSVIADGIRIAGITAHLTAQYRTAAAMFERLWPMSRDWSDAYNAACAHARAGALDEAMTWLALAAKRPWFAERDVRADNDLCDLHGRPDFDTAAASFPRWAWRRRAMVWSERVARALYR